MLIQETAFPPMLQYRTEECFLRAGYSVPPEGGGVFNPAGRRQDFQFSRLMRATRYFDRT